MIKNRTERNTLLSFSRAFRTLSCYLTDLCAYYLVFSVIKKCFTLPCKVDPLGANHFLESVFLNKPTMWKRWGVPGKHVWPENRVILLAGKFEFWTHILKHRDVFRTSHQQHEGCFSCNITSSRIY